MKSSFFLVLTLGFLVSHTVTAQLGSQSKQYTKGDTLRGSIGKERSWWDVKHYTISVEPDFANKTIIGKVAILFNSIAPGNRMQIDLQEPLELNNASIGNQQLAYAREGNVYFLDIPFVFPKDSTATLVLSYSGKVKTAVRPPWDGGWIFAKDKQGRPWMTVACQGLGASVWYPCKDHQSDEPEQGALLNITVPDTLIAIGNGRMLEKFSAQKGSMTYRWKITHPINNYNIVPYIGKYVSFGETYAGEGGKLDCTYWVLDYNLEKAKKQFTQVQPMLQAFEHWFGPYPFYQDGFKLVEAPHLGMEHQSAIAYGNGYQNGYRGRDLSSTGWGLNWDYILVHESGHEWFGNNITTKDIADMWVHEGFTNYAEVVYTDYHYGKQAGNAYLQGLRALIENESPVIGRYGVNEEGSGDMYYKGANLIHYIRQLIHDDEKFRTVLRNMNSVFFHKTTSTAEIEQFWINQTQIDLKPLFDQYLRDTRIPTLQLRLRKNKLQYRWSDCLPGFNMPVGLIINGTPTMVQPSIQWKEKKQDTTIESIETDKNYYVGFRKMLWAK